MTSAPATVAGAVPTALQRLRDTVADVQLGLPTPERDSAAKSAHAVVDQVDDYLLPRLRDLDAPLLTVVGGSTGAGSVVPGLGGGSTGRSRRRCALVLTSRRRICASTHTVGCDSPPCRGNRPACQAVAPTNAGLRWAAVEY